VENADIVAPHMNFESMDLGVVFGPGFEDRSIGAITLGNDDSINVRWVVCERF